MAITKVLARDWVLKKGGVEVGGLNTLTFSNSKTSAETTDFSDEGHAAHIVAERASSIAAEGFFLEMVLDADGDFFAEITVTVEPTGDGDITITLNATGGEDFVVGILDADSLAGVATKIAAIIDADGDWAASATGAVVRVEYTTGAKFTYAFVDTGTTGAVATALISGDRDPGQAAVDALALLIGLASVEEFVLTSPGGTIYTFDASVEMSDIGGGNNDPTSYGFTLEVSGTIAVT